MNAAQLGVSSAVLEQGGSGVGVHHNKMPEKVVTVPFMCTVYGKNYPTSQVAIRVLTLVGTALMWKPVRCLGCRIVDDVRHTRGVTLDRDRQSGACHGRGDVAPKHARAADTRAVYLYLGRRVLRSASGRNRSNRFIQFALHMDGEAHCRHHGANHH